jgi:hypothetical protein
LAGSGEGGLHPDAVVELVDPGLYHAHLAPDEDVGHWSNAFTPRPYPRTVSFARVGGDWRTGRGLLLVQFPERRSDPGRLAVVVGIRSVNPEPPLGHDGVVIEALATIPWSPGGGADLGAAQVFTPSPEAMAVLRGEANGGG